jgi:hypothetical protein
MLAAAVPDYLTASPIDGVRRLRVVKIHNTPRRRRPWKTNVKACRP